MELSKGQTTALTGDCGTGKSTLLQIILKFYTPKNGTISIGDKNIQDINTPFLRKLIGYIPQEVHLFNTSLMDNIRLSQEYSDEEFRIFWNEFGFEKYFPSLQTDPAKNIGPIHKKLSAGQKQLLGFARALFKSSEILLMDEATASMDSQMEDFVISILHRINPHTMILFTTHRKELLRIADSHYTLSPPGYT